MMLRTSSIGHLVVTFPLIRMLLPYLELCQGLQLRQRFQAPGSGQRVQVSPGLLEALPGRLHSCLAPATSHQTMTPLSNM